MDVVRSAAELLAPAPAGRGTEQDAPAPSTLGARLLAVAGRLPDHPAVIAARRDLTYRELLSTASALAPTLSGRASVGICAEPGWEQVVGVAAAALAGVPWFAVDPTAPRSAHWHRMSSMGCTTVLIQSWLVTRTEWPAGTTLLEIDRTDPADEVLAHADGSPYSPACYLGDDVSEDGRLSPLGHDGVVGPLLDLADQVGLGPTDRVLAVCPLGEATGTSQLYLPLLAGAAVVVPDDIDIRTPAAWVELMRSHSVTLWHATPALTVTLVEHLLQRGDDRPENLRVAVLGGEPVQAGLVRWLRRCVGSERLRVVGVEAGGPAGIWITSHEVRELDPRQGHLPAGVPLAGRRAVVLGDTHDACPPWVPGRLHVGARGLAPVVDGQDLVALPDGEAVLRTRWTARRVADGVLEVLGDATSRITVSGHALNLRDVEAAIATHEDVLVAVVMPAGDGCTAFVRVVPGRTLTADQVLDHLRTRMSPYLLPQRVELVGGFPLDASGRTDRTALARRSAPAPVKGAPTAPTRGTPPRALVEQACALAARILGVADVAPDLNLLDVGASSVQLVQLAVQAEAELGIEPDVEELLRFPSVGVLVSFAGDSGADESPSAPPAREAPTLVVDPVERQVFTDSRPGLRKDLDGRAGTDLPAPRIDRTTLARRRTERVFDPAPVPLAGLATLLGATARVDDAASGAPRHAYPSAGSLYPVRVYVTVGPSRVPGLQQGTYYYHPDEHRLVLLGDAVPAAAAYAWVNRDAYRSSGFAIHLVGHLPAIEPLYGTRARDYCLIEAGAMCQLLMVVAADAGLGLCPVGDLDAEAVGGLLALGPDDEIVHTLVGGVPASPVGDQDGMLSRLARLRGRDR
jgi:SagB-type dehydrogenase family enzyme